jgi:hypothetical protein
VRLLGLSLQVRAAGNGDLSRASMNVFTADALVFSRLATRRDVLSREGRTGTRMIRVSTNAENTVSTVSAARSRESRGDQAKLAGVSE